MAEHIVERRVQLRGRSFVLTIPKKMAAEMGLRRGQGIRFIMVDGGLVVMPTDIGVAGPNPDGGRFEAAISDMMGGVVSETSADAQPRPGSGAKGHRIRRP